MLKKSLIAACCVVGLAIGLPLVAQEMGGGDKKQPGGPQDSEMAKAMEQMMKLAAPGEHHRHLAPLAGKWAVAGRFRMSPDQSWETSQSESETEWVLGGRFLLQRVRGEPMPGMPTPFEGLGMTGYDNAKKKYVTTWADNMGTMLIYAEGTCSQGGKDITYVFDMLDCMTQREITVRMVIKIESNDKYVMEWHQPGPDGKEFLGMVLTSTRKKG